jgi:hypothetical protein
MAALDPAIPLRERNRAHLSEIARTSPDDDGEMNGFKFTRSKPKWLRKT